ncbi:MAG: helix-turn-helix domain-containing protein [Imperialibacter sp.]|uniref:helix-turn-helix domain-containing protein n=1 Tax=Imperialibacter sp. TaxID=2038411 RepID=UPI003A86F704
MMDKNNIKSKYMSDAALLSTIGEFVRHHRLEQNKTQSQLAEEAGINRTTLVEFEQGKRSNTLTLIQLLRALNQLQVLELFKVEKKLSPLQLAKLEQTQRQRASKRKDPERSSSDW